MTTNREQAQHASNPSQERVDDWQASDVQATQTVPERPNQAPTPTESSNENMAGGAPSVAESPQDQQQAPPDGYEDTPGATSSDEEGTARRIESGSATQQQTAGAAPTSQQEPFTPPQDASSGVNTGAGTDGEQSLVADPSGYAMRWESIQVGFVDDPRSAVQEAETLVSNVMTEMTGIFQQQRQQLEEQWSGGNQASTDDLRVAFQRYRDFFQRLLHV